VSAISARGSAHSPADPTCGDGALGERRYILCTAGDQADQDLVVALHGRGSSAAGMQAHTALHEAAAAQGVAVVYPESLDGGWGDDTFTSPGRPAGDEDVVFLDALVAELRADDRIADEGDIGVAGFSNGASMAMRYTAERPDDVRAAVAVAGQLPRDPAEADTAVERRRPDPN
jgi:polyhydroxybutyrate depolymerase